MNIPIVGVEKCLTIATTEDDWIKLYKEVIKNLRARC